MTEVEKLAEKMKHLPEEARAEVYDFVEFLEQKHGGRSVCDSGDKRKGKKALLKLGEGLGEVPVDMAEKHDRYFC